MSALKRDHLEAYASFRPFRGLTAENKISGNTPIGAFELPTLCLGGQP